MNTYIIANKSGTISGWHNAHTDKDKRDKNLKFLHRCTCFKLLLQMA